MKQTEELCARSNGLLPGGEEQLADDSRLSQAMEEYQALLAAGEKPNRNTFLARYPEIADTLADCLAGLDFLHAAVPNLSAPLADSTPLVGPDGGKPLGDFRLISELGRGGMGIVYEAEQVSLGRRVALKVLPFAATMDPRHLQRFRNETQAAAALKHPHIVGIYSVGCERGVYYYAMELIEGRTLAQVIDELRKASGAGTKNQSSAAAAPMDRGPIESAGLAAPEPRTVTPVSSKPFPFSPAADTQRATLAAGSTRPSPRAAAMFRSAAQLGLQAAEALEHAHDSGVVHRDIKPSNLMVDACGQVSITDFGLAMIEGDPALTMSGDILGTLRYMSPEQALSNRREMDHRTDIYSLGVTLYELLTLQPAFGGDDRKRLIRQVVEEDPPPPRSVNPAIPRDLETIVLKAMAKEPSQRYTVAQEFADDLRHFLADEPIHARPPTLADRVAKWARRHRPLVWSAVLIALVTLVASTASLVLISGAYERERQEHAAAVNNAAKAEENAAKARNEAAIARAVNDFINQDLLGSASPHSTPDRDISVRDVLSRAARTIEGKFADQPLVEAAIRMALGDAFNGLGEDREAEPQYVKALAIRRRVLGEEHLDTLSTMNSLACLYKSQGRYAEAETLFVETLAICRRVLGEEHQGTFATMNNLATVYDDQDRYAESEPLFVKTLAIERRVLGEENADTLSTMNNLAEVYHSQGRYAEAETLLVETLAIRRRVLGAEPLFVKGREIERRVLGEEHPNTLITMHNLATLYCDQGRYAEAEPLLVKTLAISRRVLGEEHYDTLSTMSALAALYRDKGRYGESEPLYVKTLESARRVLGAEHPLTRNVMNNLTRLYLDAGRYDDAQRMSGQLLEINRRMKGIPDQGLAKSLTLLGASRCRAGKHVEAEPVLRESVAIWEKSQPDRWEGYYAASLLGESLAGQGRSLRASDAAAAEAKFAGAEPLLLSGYEGLSARRNTMPYARREKYIPESLRRIVSLYQSWGREEKAKAWKDKLMNTGVDKPEAKKSLPSPPRIGEKASTAKEKPDKPK